MNKEQMQATLERALAELATPIDRFLNSDTMPERKIGFLLCAFEFAVAGGGLAYVSSAKPESLAVAIVELLERIPDTGRIETIRDGGRA